MLRFKCFSVCFCLIAISFAYEGFPTREDVSQWAEELKIHLHTEFDRLIGVKNLEKVYDDLRKAKLHKIDGYDLVHKMSKDMTENFKKKMRALKKLVAAAEKTVKHYKYNHFITKVEEHEFVRMNFSENDTRLIYSEKFKKGVNFSYSGVHLPVEIFERYPEILNGLKWSSALDKVFQENLKNDSELMWQHFGSQAGFMRTYPAKRWEVLPKKPSFPDLYDVRLRPWYVHASSSPKDIVILMDLSGSMHGQTMEIMKIAVKTLLTTLGENDFVNVASFNNTVRWISCFDTLVQANRRNKQILSKGIDSLKDGNMANLSLALKFAFEALAKFKDNSTDPWIGANCNKVIMLFSDGGTEEAWDVLEKYNSDKSIRVFTYAIGPHPVPYATLKEIACSNRGYYTSIQAMGAVRTKIQDYVKVLARPLVLSGAKNFEWTNFYLDPSGLGMMTTITLPVFNTSEVNGNQSMVGVMGVDVALQEMLEFEPSYEIGPGGYSFCINQNGYIVFHPNLKTEFEYIDDPPHLDFLDVEIESEAKGELRRAMINLETSKRSFVSLLKMSDGKHIVQHQMEYYFTPVNLTSFSLAVVLPNNRTHYLIAKGIDFDEEFNLKDHEMQGMHLAPWKYCHGTVLELSISEIISNLSYTVKHSPDSCKMHLLERLVWDIRKTSDIIHYWQSEWQDGKRNNIVATFVQSEGGLTRIFPARSVMAKQSFVSQFRIHEDIGIYKSDYLENQMNPSRSLIFQRAYYENDYVFLPNENDYDLFSDASDPVITIAKTITFSRSGIVYKPAVVGLMVEPSWLIPYLKSVPIHLNDNEFGCSDPDYIVCYIIDDGGFIMSSNQIELYNSTGKFLGYIDPQIMSELYEKNIYKRNEDINYEDRCPKPKKKKNAGFRTLASPFYSSLSFLDIGWLFDVSAWSYLKYWLLSLFSFMNVPNSQALPEFYVLPNETICTTHEAQYYWGNWASSYAGEISFSNCTRYYSLAKVGEMNIILLVTSKPCQLLSFEYVEPLLQAKEEVVAPNSSLCNRPLRYRKRPDKCFSYSSEEDNSDCAGVGKITLFNAALIIELLSLKIIAKMLTVGG